VTARPAVVGAFIIGAFGLTVFLILFFGGTHWFSGGSRVVVFFHESIAGLDTGAPVTLRGAPIGLVKSITIRLSPDAITARIPVVLELQADKVTWEDNKRAGGVVDFKRLVEAGLRAQLALQSFITGQLRVDLDVRPETPVELVGRDEGLPEIPTIESDLGHFREEVTKLKLKELTEAGQRALSAVERLADHFDDEVGPLSVSVHTTLDAATNTLKDVDEAVRRVQAEASTALHDADLLLVDAHRQVDNRGGELSRALISADRAVNQAEIFLRSLNSLAEPRAQFRGNLEAAVRDLAATASSLRSFAETVERNPNSLLLGRGSR
jgi:paraquat-inducible protein B